MDINWDRYYVLGAFTVSTEKDRPKKWQRLQLNDITGPHTFQKSPNYCSQWVSRTYCQPSLRFLELKKSPYEIWGVLNSKPKLYFMGFLMVSLDAQSLKTIIWLLLNTQFQLFLDILELFKMRHCFCFIYCLQFVWVLVWFFT